MQAIASDVTSDHTVILRPLHARGLVGQLAIDVGGYLVEFRHRSEWDSGIPRSRKCRAPCRDGRQRPARSGSIASAGGT